MVQLDGLRAVGALLVMAAHWFHIPQRLFDGALVYLGRVGVLPFFVLSGFLITMVLLRVRAKAEAQGIGRRYVLRTFYVRRVLRIVPLYYAALALGALAGLPQITSYWPWHLTYLSNVLFSAEGMWPAYVAHFWSLSVEEQFYLVWPLIVLFAPRRLLVPLTLGAMALAPLFRGWWVWSGGSPIAAIVLPVGLLDTLGIGALLAILMDQGRQSRAVLLRALRWGTGIGLGGLVGLHVGLAYDVLPTSSWTLTDTLLAPALAAIVAAGAQGFRGRTGRLLSWGPLVYLGRISYGLYVFHLLAMGLVDRGLAWMGWADAFAAWPLAAQAACWFIVTVGLSAGCWHTFEARLHRLKRYVPYIPSAAAASAKSSAPAATPRVPASA
ncbi:acyltransferase family protein [Salisaeta longa]|uniref:acyltransferase family protein n=1 Tax=Salisaeta longa TaxID=503170 RepID=UPI0003B5A5CD|nr:acyltransferase [Salisaeta longa]